MVLVVRCSLCGEVLECPKSDRIKLFYHIQTKHPDIAMEDPTNDQSSSNVKSRNLTKHQAASTTNKKLSEESINNNELPSTDSVTQNNNGERFSNGKPKENAIAEATQVDVNFVPTFTRSTKTEESSNNPKTKIAFTQTGEKNQQNPTNLNDFQTPKKKKPLFDDDLFHSAKSYSGNRKRNVTGQTPKKLASEFETSFDGSDKENDLVNHKNVPPAKPPRTFVETNYERKYSKFKPLKPEVKPKSRNAKLYRTTVEKWRPGKSKISCPNCGEIRTPIIKSKQDKVSKSPIGAAFIMTCWPFCFLPYLFPPPTYEYLHCRVCNHFLGKYDHKLDQIEPNDENNNVHH